MKRAGANRVVSPYATSGRLMGLLALRPGVVESLDVAGERRVRLDELLIEEGSPLVGRSIGEACDPAVPLVLVRSDSEAMANPDQSLRLAAGDLLILFGEPAALRAAEGG